MRTTISLSDGLAADVKRRAAEQGISVSALIESLVRQGLYADDGTEPAPPFRLVTFSGSGPRPDVDLDRAARIASDEDVHRGVDKMGR